MCFSIGIKMCLSNRWKKIENGFAEPEKEYISVYIRNSEIGASCYYRVIQYTNLIKECRFKINNGWSSKDYALNLNRRGKWYENVILPYLVAKLFFNRFVSLSYDVIRKPRLIIIQRQVFPRFLPLVLRVMERMLCDRTEVIWDFDDDVICGETSRNEVRLLEAKSKLIIVTSNTLRSLISESNRYKVELMPTTDGGCGIIDVKVIQRKLMSIYPHFIRICWVGTPVNLKYIDNCIAGLEEAASVLKKNYGKQLELLVICSKRYKAVTNQLRIVNKKWTHETAVQEICSSHIGIMPLEDTKTTRGKGAFKLIQYMGCGIPIVASDVGYNSQVVDSDANGYLVKDNNLTAWRDAIIALSIDIDKWITFSDNAKEKYEKNFSFSKNLERWKVYVKKYTS